MEYRKLTLLVSLLLLAALASAHAAEWGELGFSRCYHADSCTWNREGLHLVLHPGDERAEAEDPARIPYGAAASYHFTLRIPSASELTNGTARIVLAQFHAENGESPVFALRLREGRLAVTLRADGEETIAYLATYVPGWHAFDVTLETGRPGLTRVILDGTTIVDLRAPLGYQGLANYFKIGPYDYTRGLRSDFALDYADFRRDY